MLKTVEMIMDFRRNPPCSPPLTIMNICVSVVILVRLNYLLAARKEYFVTYLFLFSIFIEVYILDRTYC